MTKLKFLAIVVLLSIMSCGQQQESAPAEVLEKEKFIDVAVDLRLAEANARVARQMQQYEEHMLDSAYFVIYEIHDVTSEQVRASLAYYGERPETMKEINDRVLEKLNRIN